MGGCAGRGATTTRVNGGYGPDLAAGEIVSCRIGLGPGVY